MVLLDTGQSSPSLSQRKQYSEHEHQGVSYIQQLSPFPCWPLINACILSNFLIHLLWALFVSFLPFVLYFL